jgi:hypothetical protein
MQLIKSLHDVIQKGPTPEDKCTNALVWLLQRCSFSVARELLALAGIDIGDVEGPVKGYVRQHFPSAVPDALLELQGPLWVLIETKIHPGTCTLAQLQNHYSEAVREYGDGLRILLLSVERKEPSVLSTLSTQYPGRFYYLSWQQMLRYLDSKRANLDHEHRAFLEEFFAVVRDQKLWSLFSMTIDELRNFLTHYPFVAGHEAAAENVLDELTTKIRVRCIASSLDRAEDASSEDRTEYLPCLYTSFKIREWHTTLSAYAFLNAAIGKMGVILTGYQDDKKEREAFSSRWHSKFKDKFVLDPNLQSFVWVKEDGDELAGQTGYFKEVSGTSGHAFDPLKIELFQDTFYWGYSLPLDVTDFDTSASQLASSFRNLLDSFSPVPQQLPGKVRSIGSSKLSRPKSMKKKASLMKKNAS